MKNFLYLALLPPLITGCLGGDDGGGTEATVTDKGNIGGTVTDFVSGSALSSVAVSVGSTTTITNSSGVFTLNSLDAGSRTVTATLTGYDNHSGTATVSKGTTITYNIRMTQTNSQQGSVNTPLNWDNGDWDQTNWQ